METKSPRLIAFTAWKKLNATNTKRVARESGVPYTTLASFVQGDTLNLSAPNEQRVADFYRCAVEDIFVRPRKIGESRQQGVRIVGKASAGPDGSYVSTEDEGEEMEPFNPEETIAVRVEGTSMTPRFRPGEVAVFGPMHDDPTPLVNQEVLVMTDDERQMIKILRKNAEPGHWDLHSINSAFDPIEGVALIWARPFEGLRV